MQVASGAAFGFGFGLAAGSWVASAFGAVLFPNLRRRLPAMSVEEQAADGVPCSCTTVRLPTRSTLRGPCLLRARLPLRSSLSVSWRAGLWCRSPSGMESQGGALEASAELHNAPLQARNHLGPLHKQSHNDPNQQRWPVQLQGLLFARI